MLPPMTGTRSRPGIPRLPDVLVIGAGIIGAACAYYCTSAGLRVTVVERGAVGGGTTGACEGNILVSDKETGPELDLALLCSRLWRGKPDETGGRARGGRRNRGG